MTATTSNDINVLDAMIPIKYGDRHINSVGDLLDEDDGDINLLSDILWLKYSTKWDRLWSDYIAEYNPIWNVDGTVSETETRDLEANHTGTDTLANSGQDSETHTGTDTTQRTGTDTIAQSGQDSETHTGTDTMQHTGTDTTANGVYGFDSNSSVPSDTSEETKNLTDTDTKNLTDTYTHGKTETETRNLTDTDTKNLTDTYTHGKTETQTKNLKDTDEGTITRETTRQGNIGVTMTQQMLEADRNYWNDIKSLFYDGVVCDIVNDITYKIFVP